MGNETTTQVRKNRNSYSMDFGHEMPDKILPNKEFKLAPMNSNDRKQQTLRRTSRMSSLGPRARSQIQKSPDEQSRQASQRLNKLNLINDELRKELIKISSELTIKLKKKKYTPKTVIKEEQNEKQRTALKRQLENAYKQIDMYKRNIEQLKSNETSDKTDEKLVSVQNQIGVVDLSISEVAKEIQSLRNVMNNQSAGMKKDRTLDRAQQLKSEAEAVRISLRDINKESRKKEKKYMQQHHYMMILEKKIREINGQYFSESGKQESISTKIEQKEVQEAEQELQLLKIKHDQYHKKINALLLTNRQLKQAKRQLKQQFDIKKKEAESLKYKRDAFVKQIKDNLHLFYTRHEHDEEDLSQFSSGGEGEEVSPVMQQMDERGTFDIEHLKDHTLKSKPKEDKEIILAEEAKMMAEEPRQQPKQWKKRVTRIVQKGKPKEDEKPFDTGLKKQSKNDLRIVMMNIWMTKKKQITAIQPVYLVDGEVIQGDKSSNNVEDQYRVAFQLPQFDYIKSILGIIGKEGFIQYLVLQSHYGKVSKIGRSQTIGDNFAIGVAKEERPIQITGASALDGNYYRINRLQFQVLIEPN